MQFLQSSFVIIANLRELGTFHKNFCRLASFTALQKLLISCTSQNRGHFVAASQRQNDLFRSLSLGRSIGSAQALASKLTYFKKQGRFQEVMILGGVLGAHTTQNYDLYTPNRKRS